MWQLLESGWRITGRESLTVSSYHIILISWTYLYIYTNYTYLGGPICGHFASTPASLMPHPFRVEHSVVDWTWGEGRAAVQVSWTMRARVKTVRKIHSFIVTGKSATFWSYSRDRVGLYGVRADYSETGLTPPQRSPCNYVNRYIHNIRRCSLWEFACI